MFDSSSSQQGERLTDLTATPPPPPHTWLVVAKTPTTPLYRPPLLLFGRRRRFSTMYFSSTTTQRQASLAFFVCPNSSSYQLVIWLAIRYIYPIHSVLPSVLQYSPIRYSSPFLHSTSPNSRLTSSQWQQTPPLSTTRTVVFRRPPPPPMETLITSLCQRRDVASSTIRRSNSTVGPAGSRGNLAKCGGVEGRSWLNSIPSTAAS